MFERVYLINLRRRPDRLARFAAMRAADGWDFPDPEIFPAVDGAKCTPPDYFIHGGGAWGCLRSHTAVLDRCVTDGVGSVLVLEDDVTWQPDTWARLRRFMQAAPADWDQLMLGGQHMRRPEQIAPGVVRVAGAGRTHAYAVRGPAMLSLLRLWYTSQRHIDHVMCGWQRQWKVYAPDPFLFGQCEGQSDISGRRDDVRFWSPPGSDIPIFHVTAPPDVVAALRGMGIHTGHDRDPVSGYDRGLVALAGGGKADRQRLAKWLSVVLWEAASAGDAAVAVWHPSITVDDVRMAAGGRMVFELDHSTIDGIRGQMPSSVRLRPNRAGTHVILLKSSREVMEGLRLKGWHSGHWRDGATGIDNGLAEAMTLPPGDRRRRKLDAWVECVAGEAKSIPGGVATAWHPELTVAELGPAAYPMRVVEIVTDSVGEALAVFDEVAAQ